MKNIVAAEAGSMGITLYFHDGAKFRTENLPFTPFVLLSADAAAPENCQMKELDGKGFFCRQAFFSSFETYEKQLPELKKSPGVMCFRDLLQQALTMHDLRLFGGMDFSALRKMQFSMRQENEVITAVQISDSEGFIQEFTGSEAEIISAFNNHIKTFDPDILMGFNCCRYDLPLLIKRAKKCKVTLDCGRDGTTFADRRSRFSAGEKQYSYQRFSLNGRHIIDLFHAVLLFDAAHRDLEETELPEVREYFALKSDFTAQMLGELGEILLPAYFYRTRELPLSFQDCLLRGSGSALDALMIAEYLKRGKSIALPEVSRPYTGALTSMESAGIFHHVRHCDVRSLYPSLLLSLNTAPARDDANIFLPLLDRLRTFRLAAKDKARTLPDGMEKRQLESLQSSFKILINSFYGYLAFPQGSFNDFALAEKITTTGRELLAKLVFAMSTHGAKVIEMDTDGIYFQSPDGDDGTLDTALNAVLPDGIQLEFDAEYPAMYSYKAKNYALLDKNGKISLTGAALKSRALEPFQRKFIMQIVSAGLHNDPQAAKDAYWQWHQAIAEKTIPLEDLAKSEILSDSPENYRKKLSTPSARRSAPYELALASGKKYRTGDKVKFYVTGSKARLPVVGNCKLLEDAGSERDENTAYYLAKLDALADTFNVIR